MGYDWVRSADDSVEEHIQLAVAGAHLAGLLTVQYDGKLQP